MAKRFNSTIKKLQRAINTKIEDKILVNKTQIYHHDTDIVTEMIIVKKAVWDNEKQRNKYQELFHSSSDVQIVLFLRDYWYELNGMEIPKDNEQWNKIKEKLAMKETEEDAGNKKVQKECD